MRATILQWQYCGLSTASEVFLIFNTQLYSYVDKREVLQQEYSQPPTLPSHHFRWVVKDVITLTVSVSYSSSIVREVS